MLDLDLDPNFLHSVETTYSVVSVLVYTVSLCLIKRYQAREIVCLLHLCHLLITFAKRMDLDQTRKNFGNDLDPILDAIKNFFSCLHQYYYSVGYTDSA